MNYRLDATSVANENEMDFTYGLVELIKAIYYLSVVSPKDLSAKIEVIFEFSNINLKSDTKIGDKESGRKV